MKKIKLNENDLTNLVKRILMEDENNKNMPNTDGWYWVLIDGYDDPTPCWYMNKLQCFLPGGLGDSSSMGLYEDDIVKVGPEIIVPEF